MEPSGRNRWQPVTNGMRSKTAQTERSATGRDPRQRFGSDATQHGKEGVNGSSPLEGSIKALLGGAFFFVHSCRRSSLLCYGAFSGARRFRASDRGAPRGSLPVSAQVLCAFMS